MSLKIYNTLTKQKELFQPMAPGEVKMFVCGPTVYDLSHIGHAKTYTQFDFVARYLRKKGYAVEYIQNITDIDDKIINKANTLDIPTSELSSKFEKLFIEDMQTLGNKSVDLYARASDYMDAIVGQVQKLIERGFAYKLEDGWYFDISKYSEYGKLSGRRILENEDAVSTVDDNNQKRSPGDFALWKMRKQSEPYWDTSLGQGRPGWHIEDTSITEALFGPQYDLHGGALDLIFPHHENEIAQMEAASGKTPMVRYWMHTGLVRVRGAKMGKSNNNFTTIRDALKSMDVETLRYIFLSQHYRSSVELGEESIENAVRARRRVENFSRLIDVSKPESDTALESTENYRTRFSERLDDDFDTPGALAVLFEFIREQNRGGVPGRMASDFINEVNGLFGVFTFDTHTEEDSDIEKEIEKRNILRRAGKYDEADSIRTNLASRGIALEDTAEGTHWWR